MHKLNIEIKNLSNDLNDDSAEFSDSDETELAYIPKLSKPNHGRTLKNKISAGTEIFGNLNYAAATESNIFYSIFNFFINFILDLYPLVA